jgi:hypothetical protein
MKQLFYCFGASTFNFSQVEISTKEEGIYPPENSRHYFAAVRETIPYKDLITNKVFKV